MEDRPSGDALKGLTAPYFNSARAGGLAKLGRALLNLPLRVVGRPQEYFNDAVRNVLSSLSMTERRLEERVAAIETTVSALGKSVQTGRSQPVPSGRTARQVRVDDWQMRIRPGRFDEIYSAPAHQVAQERTVLYAIVFGTQPARCLEIGTLEGGSPVIICAALDDIGAGRIACVDPNPRVSADTWERVSHRATMIRGMSPESLHQAADILGGPFDFAFIDGDHEREGVIRDIEGVLPLLAPTANLMFHDAHYFGIGEAIDDMLLKHRDCLFDCGMISVRATPTGTMSDGREIVWGGMRLLRYVKAA